MAEGAQQALLKIFLITSLGTGSGVNALMLFRCRIASINSMRIIPFIIVLKSVSPMAVLEV
jgi:hypothetical protein